VPNRVVNKSIRQKKVKQEVKNPKIDEICQLEIDSKVEGASDEEGVLSLLINRMLNENFGNKEKNTKTLP
jgi:hypothetical protein